MSDGKLTVVEDGEVTETRPANRTEELRATTRRRAVLAARIQLSTGAEVNKRLIDDISEQVGIHPHAFRTLFPTDDDFLDAINESLVAETAQRLRHCVDSLTADSFVVGEDRLAEVAHALASSWPLTRGAMLIRANRRVRGLTDNRYGQQIAEAERQFVGALLDIFTDLMAKLDRRFTWSPKLAVRIILDTYERSFESWLLDGHDEAEFNASPYVKRTLPALLGEMSVAL